MSSADKFDEPSAERKHWYFFRLIRELDRFSLQDPSRERDRGDKSDIGVIGLQKLLGLWIKKFVDHRENDEGGPILFRMDEKIIERQHQAPEHMFVVTARVQILAEWLGLGSQTTQQLMLAAAIHDAFKAEERKITGKKGTAYRVFREVDKAEEAALRESGVDEGLIKLQNAAGHPFNDAHELNLKAEQGEELTELEKAFLILYVTDMSTRGVSPATYDPIKVRTEFDEQNYPEFHESARREFIGDRSVGGFEAMRITGHAAEGIIARLVSEDIDPKSLMVLVDAEIERRIESTDD